MTILLIALGGAIGALCRYAMYQYIDYLNKNSIIATLMVNIIASLIVGIVFGLLLQKYINESIRLFVIIGFAGSFSTMSAFSIESVQLLHQGNYTLFIINALVNIILPILAAFLGLQCIKLIH